MSKNEKEQITVQILRRREVGPVLLKGAEYNFISVSYATAISSPEFVRIDKRFYSPEKELEIITERIKDRLKKEDIEVILQEKF